ncbi:DUF7504 family protein [Haloarchaeobius sp. TZWWS8]|uniref:DUF7504 family protein n=1 Tax=Haloarchaeobius sp. TZWWS8 TaxID=3446121 RepID=UPI003EBBC252
MSLAESGFDGAAVPEGTNLLVAGPAMTGKRRLMYELLAGDSRAESARALITTRKGADRVEREYRDVHPDVGRLGVVDCVSRQRGFSGSHSSENRRYVSDPGDLTGIGIRTSEFMRQFQTDDDLDDVRVGLHTSSTVLMYTDLRRVFQFVHVLTGRIESAGFVGVFVVDTPTADDTIELLKQPFDGLVETRDDDDDGRQVRIRGVEMGPRRWTTF